MAEHPMIEKVARAMSERKTLHQTQPDVRALVEFHRKDCNRFVNGGCQTHRCMSRGGWKPGAGLDLATCEAKETADALERLSAENADLARRLEAAGQTMCDMLDMVADGDDRMRAGSASERAAVVKWLRAESKRLLEESIRLREIDRMHAAWTADAHSTAFNIAALAIEHLNHLQGAEAPSHD